MNLKFYVNDYILIWNLLFQASISEPVNKLKQKIWTNYQEEYNNTFRDKNLILLDIKNFIPNDDTIYNIVLATKEYENVKKKTEKYRLELMQLWDSNKKTLSAFIKNIVKKDIRPYNILVIDEDHDLIDVSYQDKDFGTIIVGKQITKKTPTQILIDIVLAIIKEEITFPMEKFEFGTAIIELAVLNELATLLTKNSCYISGQPSLTNLKRNLYPYWLMYLSIPKDKFPFYMKRDNIFFESDSIAYEKKLPHMNLEEFINYCCENKEEILKQQKQ